MVFFLFMYSFFKNGIDFALISHILRSYHGEKNYFIYFKVLYRKWPFHFWFWCNKTLANYVHTHILIGDHFWFKASEIFAQLPKTLDIYSSKYSAAIGLLWFLIIYQKAKVKSCTSALKSERKCNFSNC